MKKFMSKTWRMALLLAFVAGVTLTVSAAVAPAASDSPDEVCMAGCNAKKAEQRALQAAQSCIANAPCSGPSYAVNAFAEPNGCGYTVSISCGPECNGPGPCPAGPTYLVATVEVDCDCNVSSVTCYF